MSRPGKSKGTIDIGQQRRSYDLAPPFKKRQPHNGECPTCGTKLINFRPSIHERYSYCPKCGWTNRPQWKKNA